MLQTEALEIMKTGSNVFLTGVPGAGKTYVINKYIEYLESCGVYPAITASTGIASTHVGGATIHSWSGIGIEKDIDEWKLDAIMTREKLVKKIQNTNVLIIDEISMIDAQTLDNVDKVCRAIKNPEKAFGGIQVIFVGDFFQLPPVSRMGEKKHFAFAGNSWKAARPLTCYLEEQYRQSDEIFTNLLLAIRANNVDEMHVEILDEIVKRTKKKLGIKEEKVVGENGYLEDGESTVEVGEEEKEVGKKGGGAKGTSAAATKNRNVEAELIDILELHSHNKDVDSINTFKLGLIEEKEYRYEMITVGKKQLVEGLIKNCLSPQTLILKEGAKVMFTKNDVEGKYVNGTLGTVNNLSSFSIEILTNSGKYISVKQADWAIEEDGKVKAKISQYPLRLAWAITVHKSQGMSLDSALLNLGDSFEYGQGYVALSRLRSLEGLHLKSFNAKSLRVNEAIAEFDEKILKDSRFIQEKFVKSTSEILKKLHDGFIIKCGGKVGGGVAKKEKIEKLPTQEITFRLIEDGLSFEEIVLQRDMVAGTILSHLEDLLAEKKIDVITLSGLADKKYQKVPKEVKKAFKMFEKDEEKKGKLAPVFNELEKKYTYDELRWFRFFL